MSKTLERPLVPVGAIYSNSITEFSVWAPQAARVDLELTAPRSEIHSLLRNDLGYWQTILPVLPGTRYRYQVNGTKSFPDPASTSQPEGVHLASEVTDRNFPWKDAAWSGISLKEMILYELHTGTFSRTGTFAGIIAGLDYLAGLGINTIEIMPVGQFPGDRNWGYDVAFPFAVQHSYGGPQELKALVNAAHRKGIAVVLDVVYNHLGPEGNYLNEFGPYFTDKYHTPWGKAINFDDRWSDGVRNYYLQNALMWLDEFHIDGLRLDAVHAIYDLSALHFMKQLADAVDGLSQKLHIKKTLIAELDLNDPRYLDAPGEGGYGLDGQWVDEFHHALHVILTGEKQEYYEDFGSLENLQKAFARKFVYDGNYSVQRKRFFGAPAGHHPWSRYVVFAQNHDQVGNRPAGDRLTKTLNLEQLKLAAATVLLSPFVPLLFMGEEYGETHPFLFFSNHSDNALIAALRKGRMKEFSIDSSKDLPDPQDIVTFNRSKLSAESKRKSNPPLLQFYRKLIQLRKTREALRGKEKPSFASQVLIPEAGLLSVVRSHNGDRLYLLFNFTAGSRQLPNPWKKDLQAVLYTSDRRWAGPGRTRTSVEKNGTILMRGWSVGIFEKAKRT
jgi:maltooligosyltrehalose trehalohydrolase